MLYFIYIYILQTIYHNTFFTPNMNTYTNTAVTVFTAIVVADRFIIRNRLCSNVMNYSIQTAFQNTEDEVRKSG